jgi:GNAT superfamily N-acetyltransferase
MVTSLEDLPPAAVVDAIRANWAEFYLHLGNAPVCDLSIGPHLCWLLTGVPDAFLNVVFRCDLPPDRADDIVDEALDLFRARHIARLSWWVESSVSGVGRLLESRGLTFNKGGTAMAANLRSGLEEEPAPAGLEIIRVDDRIALGHWIEVMRVGFGLPQEARARLFELFVAVAFEPPTHTYLALLDGRPVATSQLFTGAGVAGIYNVTSLPAARGRGIGTAITRAALLEARRQGHSLAILQASRLGYPVYRRLGFLDYGHLSNYQFSSDSAARTAT